MNMTKNQKYIYSMIAHSKTRHRKHRSQTRKMKKKRTQRAGENKAKTMLKKQNKTCGI